jgi:D-alanyl-D-alanine carboxypeptidase
MMACALLLALSVTACALPFSATADTEPAFAARLRPALAAQMKSLGVPGAIVYVEYPGHGTWTATMGTSDVSTNAPMRLDAHMRVGSITKTFTGTVILQLAEEGQLGLDDPVAQYQPEVPNGKHITIRELLNMTSGLFNYSEDAGFDNLLMAQPSRVWQPKELLAIAFQHPPYFAPGQDFHYSNTNTILLGLIVEQITGKTLAEEFQQRIFTPLGMNSTSFPAPALAALPNPHPQGYASQASGECPAKPAASGEQGAKIKNQPALLCDVTDFNPSWGWAAGAAISTLHDLRIWAKALATGKLLNEDMQKERLTWSPIEQNASYGLAIFDVSGFLGHNGSLPGFQSFMGYRPDKGATVIVLTNLDQSAYCAPPASPGGTPTCTEPADALSKVIIKQVFS